MVAGGEVRSDIQLDASSKAAGMAVNAKVSGVELGRIEHVQNLIKGGKSNTSIKFTGKGESAREIMAGLNGSLVFEVGEGEINSKHINLLGSDLLVEVVQKINPLSKKGETSRLECGVIRFDVKDGVSTIDKGIAFQSGQMNVVGSGSFDLKKEILDLSLRPEARKGVGVGAGELAQLVRVAGPLSAPGLAADAKGMAKLGATIGVAVATGGTSYLAQKLLSKATQDDTPCMTALGKSSAEGSGSSKTSTPTDSPSEQKKDSVIKGDINKLWKGTKSLLRD